MSPTDFAAWVRMMKTERGWSSRECAKRLDCGVNQVKIWSDRGAPAQRRGMRPRSLVLQGGEQPRWELGRGAKEGCRKVFWRSICEGTALCRTRLASTRGRVLIA